MSKKPMTTKAEAEKAVKDIRRATRKVHNAEEKIRIVLAGLRGEDSIAELCRREGIAQGNRIARRAARCGKERQHVKASPSPAVYQ